MLIWRKCKPINQEQLQGRSLGRTFLSVILDISSCFQIPLPPPFLLTGCICIQSLPVSTASSDVHKYGLISLKMILLITVVEFLYLLSFTAKECATTCQVNLKHKV